MYGTAVLMHMHPKRSMWPPNQRIHVQLIRQQRHMYKANLREAHQHHWSSDVVNVSASTLTSTMQCQ
jgi:hypothetical protein